MTEEEVFLAVLDLHKPADKALYLDKVCGGDVEFRRRVEALLAANSKTGDFLDVPLGCQLRGTYIDPEGVTSGEENEFDQQVKLLLANHFNSAAFQNEPIAPANPLIADSVRLRADGEVKSPGEVHVDLRFLARSDAPGSLGRIGHYEVLQVLGQGGFGIVFRAFDEVLQRVVAVKVLAPQLAATSPARKRFLREARMSAQVRHENVVQVHATGEQPLPYLVMEFIPGETLQQRIDRTGPLELSEIVHIGRQIAEGLAAAHSTGLIHRDIKPCNVLIEAGQQGRVKITDFGLARAANDASLTQSSLVAGTPMYMAPEQVKGESLDHRADLFSLGSVLYVMVAGRPPFRAATGFAVMKRVVEDDPRPLRELIPETPQSLVDVIVKLHAKKPEDRFQSALEVATAIAICDAQSTALGVASPRKPVAKRSSKWRVAAACLLLPLLALGAMEIAGVTHLSRTHHSPTNVANPSGGDQSPPKRPEQAVPRTYFTNSVGMKFRLIPAGKFKMGSSAEEINRCLREFTAGSTKFMELRKRHDGAFEQERLPAEGPEHEVEITQAFYIGVTEVTVGQFRQFVEAKNYDVGDDAWKKPGMDAFDDYPVASVSWDNAVDFCNWLSEKEGKKYRLPTEAEWEYCCRAGSSGTRYSFGNRDEQLELYAWYRGNSDDMTHRVGQLKPNAWGLFDMHGNAWEWCRDNFDPAYYKTSPVKDPPGGIGIERAVRGGSQYWPHEFCRSAFRQFVAPGQRYTDLGFRVVLVTP